VEYQQKFRWLPCYKQAQLAVGRTVHWGDFVGEECPEFYGRGFVIGKYWDSSRRKYPGPG